MARKRGGAAGLWDRNKGWLKSVVPAALGAIPGVGVPLAIGAGAAMRGLDRPGKRGIGLDVGQAVRGGLEGYGMGKLGQGARAGIGKMLAPKAATGITPGLSNAEVARQLNPMLSGARISLGRLGEGTRSAVFMVADEYRLEDEQRALVSGIAGYMVRPITLDVIRATRDPAANPGVVDAVEDGSTVC